MKRRDSLAKKMIVAVPGLLLSASLLAPLAFAQEICEPISGGKECLVSPAGDDANPGTEAAPFATVAHGIAQLGPGDILTLREGAYVQDERLHIHNVNGTETAPIVIRSFPGEHAAIDGMVDAIDWVPATDPGAHEDEYVSVQTFTRHVRGAFIDREPYTRLVKYSNLNDFRADNETYEQIPCPNPTGACGDTDPRPGPARVQLPFGCEPPNCADADYRYPWVYMGPGIWIDPGVSPTNPQPVHIRLSPTHNNVPGLDDYAGPDDPNSVALAISSKDLQNGAPTAPPNPTLDIQASSNLRFEDLSIRYGGEPTVLLRGASNITFDHVQIDASSFGVRMGNVSDITFENCEVDGGNPPWLFRSDIKIAYTYLENGTAINNRGAASTVDALMVPSSNNIGTTIGNCEFINGHDLSVAGQDVDFHHNWINNMNDEGINIPGAGNTSIRVHENVLTAALDPLSLAVSNSAAGPYHIYRNLIDVRTPTAGFRPRTTGDINVWRYGNPFKGSDPDSPEYSVFQNTFLVYGRQSQATYPHYRDPSGFTNDRSFFNNIFVSVHPTAADDQAIAFLPWPSSSAHIDGNNYHKIGPGTAPLLRYLAYEFPAGTAFDAGSFDCLSGCSDPLIGSQLFNQSQSQYPPGFEASSLESDPQFMQIGADGEFRDTDDLRLSSSSPARNGGVQLPTNLADLDDDIVPPSSTPAIGAYPFGAPPLEVGVDGRRSYPESP